MIILDKINKFYKIGEKSHHILKNLSLVISSGELISIVGASGSGKSTLLNILGLLDSPHNGKYILDGRDITSFNQDEMATLRNRHIGFVFQQFNLLSRLNALRNVELPLTYSAMSSQEGTKRAKEALKRVGMQDYFNHKPNELSGGQQQRVAIARALVNNPEIILADEPTGALDTQTSSEIMQLFLSLHQEGRTILIVTHDKNIAAMCSRSILMKDGKITNNTKLATKTSRSEVYHET
jgi:putative ABC transport system ATP-binding protein